MKTHSLFLFFALTCPVLVADTGYWAKGKAYEDQFSVSCDRARGFVSDHEKDWICSAASFGLSKEEARKTIAVVMPEITRYMGMQGLAEALWLSIKGDAWVKEGVSIGPMQMKAGFVKQLAKATYANRAAQTFAQSLGLMSPTELKRLVMSPMGAFRVASLFFLHEKQRSPQPSLRLLAMRYNAGLNTPASRLENFSRGRHFPYGKGKAGTQYNYADLVRYFYATI